MLIMWLRDACCYYLFVFQNQQFNVNFLSVRFFPVEVPTVRLYFNKNTQMCVFAEASNTLPQVFVGDQAAEKNIAMLVTSYCALHDVTLNNNRMFFFTCCIENRTRSRIVKG